MLGHIMNVQRASRSTCVILIFLNLGDRWGCVVNNTSWTLYPRERDPGPIVQEAGWAPGQVGTCVENLAPPPTDGIRSPDRPVRSKSLYQLHHPSPFS